MKISLYPIAFCLALALTGPAPGAGNQGAKANKKAKAKTEAKAKAEAKTKAKPKPKPKSKPKAKPAAKPVAMAKLDWEKDLWPWFETKCVDCHRAPYEEAGKLKEPKAELRLDAAWGIVKGGENGPVVQAGKPGDSELYFRVTLPEDDSDFMPSKGDVLTKKEAEALKLWIAQGAVFGGWQGSLEGRPEDAAPAERELVPLKPSIYETLASGIAPAPEANIAAVVAAGARVESLAPESPLLRVDFFNRRDQTGDQHLAGLPALKTQLAQLNLGQSAVTDEGLKKMAGFPNLVRLDLHQTGIGDAGLAHLGVLPNLRYLNLYGTVVTDKGLEHLARLGKLEALFLWRTKATEAGIKKLQQAIPEIEISWE